MKPLVTCRASPVHGADMYDVLTETMTNLRKDKMKKDDGREECL